jgi:MFS transporter, PAT family, beta-lactamase induction signal transducer AmpG
MLPTKRSIEHLFNARMMTILFLGFSSGLPLALSTGTLQAWLADVNVDIRFIGWFSLAGLPYTLKFIWSPLMDRFVPNKLGRRRGWMFLTQCALLILITSMGLLTPDEHLKIMGMVAFFIAFCSASQDIAFDAYRTDILPAQERGFGAAVSVGGYRVAMLVSGAGALIIADFVDWKTAYFVMAGLMLVGMTTSFLCRQPVDNNAPKSLQDAVVKPFVEFINRPSAILLLVLIVLYKLGDAFAGTLTTAFLIQSLDFSISEVGVVNKGFGLIATLVGVFFGGAIMVQFGLYRSLLWFGICQAITNLGFMVLAIIGKSYIGMMAVIGLENLSGGMGTAAFVALLMALCNHKYTATQFALLSALAAIGRVFVGPPSGEIVAVYGWVSFFMMTFLIALPGLYLLIRLKTTLQSYDVN